MAADLWVQVETGLPSSKLVDRLCVALEIETHEAVGHLVMLWLAVMEVGCGGDLRDRSDLWIERSAGWRGQHGAFAAAVRQHHLDDGQIKDWRTKYGKLEAVRAEARRIKANQRARDAERQEDGPPDSPASGPPDDVVDSSPSSSSLSVVPEKTKAGTTKEPVRREVPANGRPDAVVEFCDEIGFGRFRPIVDGYIRSSRNAAALMATLRMHLAGELGHEQATGEMLGLAVQQYAVNNGGDRFNANYFAGFVRKAKLKIGQLEVRARNDQEQQHIDAEGRAAEERRREEAEGKLVMGFMGENPERYEELKRIADGQVPKKFNADLREHMVHAQLVQLIREERRT